MNPHFTYKEDLDETALKQGDVLYRTDIIESILKKVHPYYLKESFKFFMVLTQSCDLVRRSGNCKARYITLASVVTFDNVLKNEISKYQAGRIEKIGSVCDKSNKSLLYNFVEKNLNNNHKEFFYLHEDNNLGLTESCCSILRLSVVLRSNEHYDACLFSKFLELDNEFRAKLGWLVGNIYSRIGTRDWAPDIIPQTKFKAIINEILDRELYWVEKEKLMIFKEKIKKDDIDLQEMDHEDIIQSIEKIKIIRKKEKVLGVIKEKLENSNMLNLNSNIDKLIARIGSDPLFSANLK